MHSCEKLVFERKQMIFSFFCCCSCHFVVVLCLLIAFLSFCLLHVPALLEVLIVNFVTL